MKLGKEEIQKIFLGVIGVIGVTAAYFLLLLGPLQDSQDRARRGIASVGPEITKAKAQLKKTDEMKKAAPKSTLLMKDITSHIPDGSPVSWFPTQVDDFFKREGVDKAVTHKGEESVDKELEGFRRISWDIEVPRVDFARFAQALANFENDELLVEVTALQIDALHEDAEAQHVNLTVNNLAKQ
jgi:hypothetical protein